MRLSFSAELYSKLALEDAAAAVSAKGRAAISADGPRWSVEISPDELAGEFANEALSRERRRDVLRLAKEQVRLIATRALFSALEPPDHAARAREAERLSAADAERLMREEAP